MTRTKNNDEEDEWRWKCVDDLESLHEWHDAVSLFVLRRLTDVKCRYSSRTQPAEFQVSQHCYIANENR